MRTLVLGASGFVGGHCYRLLSARGDDVVGTVGPSTPATGDLRALDIATPDGLRRLLWAIKPHAVIWCIKRNAVGADERTQNEMGLSVLREFDADQRLVFVSTDGVLPGVRGPYDEATTPQQILLDHPLAAYTNAKLWAEQYVTAHFPRACTVRVGPIYGRSVLGHWDDRVGQIRAELATGRPLSRAANIRRTFIEVQDLAQALVELSGNDVCGLLHLGPATSESHLSFARKVAMVWGLPDNLIEAFSLSEDEVRRRKVRLDTTMSTAKAQQVLQTRFRSVSQGLAPEQ